MTILGLSMQNTDNISVNCRILSSRSTGVHRYLNQLLACLPQLDQVKPRFPLHGMRGHAWEQLRLPGLCRGRLLWSPSNTGPLAVRNQVVTIHDVVPLDHPEWLNPRFAAWYRFLIPRLVRRVRHVIVDSDFTRQRLIAHTGIEPGKVSVIHCGVDARFRPQSPEAIDAARAALQVPPGRYVLSVGSLEPRKNLGRLLLAWQSAMSELPADAWLVVAGAKGKGLVFADVPELARLPARVHLAGYVPEEALPALYAGADAFVYPSMYEGFGMPPLEAMACGTPVIVGNRASLPEVVGDAALSVDPFNVDALARALVDVLAQPAVSARLGIAGLARAGLFSWEKAAVQTRQVLAQAGQEQ
jgi:glycosyltransferase involved in cell wall biosynthesis